MDNYQGFDRTANPCADPIPVTNDADYNQPCESHRKCLDEVEYPRSLPCALFVAPAL